MIRFGPKKLHNPCESTAAVSLPLPIANCDPLIAGTHPNRTNFLSGEWLSDSHIHLAQTLMAQRFLLQHGLQDYLILNKYDRYNSSSKDFVQIINVSRVHWICALNCTAPPGVVHVYDSP